MSSSHQEQMERFVHAIFTVGVFRIFLNCFFFFCFLQLCVWSTKRWLKLTSIDSIQNFCTRLNNVSSLVTQIQFDPYQIELLVVQDKWISRHAAPTLDCLRQVKGKYLQDIFSDDIPLHLVITNKMLCSGFLMNLKLQLLLLHILLMVRSSVLALEASL